MKWGIMMKKLLSILLAAAMAVSFAACGNTATSTSAAQSTANTQSAPADGIVE